MRIILVKLVILIMDFIFRIINVFSALLIVNNVLEINQLSAPNAFLLFHFLRTILAKNVTS